MSLDIYIGLPVDTGSSEKQWFEAGSFNITHNVSRMWDKAGVYECLYNWHGRKAEELIEPLSNAIQDMLIKPREYETLNPKNGWGDFIGAKEFLRKVVDCCSEHPKCIIHISK